MTRAPHLQPIPGPDPEAWADIRRHAPQPAETAR